MHRAVILLLFRRKRKSFSPTENCAPQWLCPMCSSWARWPVMSSVWSCRCACSSRCRFTSTRSSKSQFLFCFAEIVYLIWISVWFIYVTNGNFPYSVVTVCCLPPGPGRKRMACLTWGGHRRPTATIRSWWVWRCLWLPGCRSIGEYIAVVSRRSLVNDLNFLFFVKIGHSGVPGAGKFLSGTVLRCGIQC